MNIIQMDKNIKIRLPTINKTFALVYILLWELPLIYSKRKTDALAWSIMSFI